MQSPDEKLNWIKELPPEQIKSALSKDIQLIYDACGLDVLIPLWENFASISFYLSTAPLAELKKIYIRKNFRGDNVKQLAAMLKVSEPFVYAALKDKNGSMPTDPTLFKF